MNNDWIGSNLINWLENNNNSVAEVKAYRKYLDSLGSSMKYPCPNCFVNNGEEHLLMVMEEHNQVKPIVCYYCKVTFLIPN